MQARVRREQAPHPGDEKHVRGLLRACRAQQAPPSLPTNLDQRAAQPVRVSRELDGRGIGQPFALARDPSLQKASEQPAQRTDDRQGKGQGGKHQGQREHPRQRANDPEGQVAHPDQASDPRDEPYVHPHVAIQDVAEFVGDDALQLIAIERVESALGHHHRGIRWRESRGERIDSPLGAEDVDPRHRHARGDRHLLDDVAQHALARVLGLRGQQGASQPAGHRAAAPQADRRVEGREQHDQQPEQHHVARDPWIVREELRERDMTFVVGRGRGPPGKRRWDLA